MSSEERPTARRSQVRGGSAPRGALVRNRLFVRVSDEYLNASANSCEPANAPAAPAAPTPAHGSCLTGYTNNNVDLA